MPHNSAIYKEIIVGTGLSLTESQFNQLELYANILLDWNAKVNLVSRKDESNIWPGHLLHSLSILFCVSVPDSCNIADMGSGGGLPGIPVAIVLSNSNIVLIESIRKKCLALENMIKRLGLSNTSVLNARAEDVAVKYKNSFDIVLARAVAPLVDLVRWSIPLVRKNQLTIGLRGRDPASLCLPALIAMKGGSLEQEISAAKKKTHFRYIESIPIEFKGIENTDLVHKSLLIAGL